MAEIRIENVTKAYGDVVAVNNFSLTVNDGELVVLLGPSGCGKTTLLRAIAGLGDLDVGRIFIGDRPVLHATRKQANPQQRLDHRRAMIRQIDARAADKYVQMLFGRHVFIAPKSGPVPGSPQSRR